MGVLKVVSSLALGAALLFSGAALAGPISAWEELRPQVFGDRAIEVSTGQVEIYAPYRATDDRSVPITLQASLPDGATIKTLTFLIDENPMPVSAVFHMEAARSRFEATLNMRLNGPSTLHAVVEDDSGRLYVAEAKVKTSGLGACAAPPVNDPEAAIASLGQMQMADTTTRAPGEATPEIRRARLEIQHPSHTGMQMNQLTLLYILARYVEEVDVWAGDQKLFSMEGSISLSENPTIEFDYPRGGADHLRVRLLDTEGAEFIQEFPIEGA